MGASVNSIMGKGSGTVTEAAAVSQQIGNSLAGALSTAAGGGQVTTQTFGFADKTQQSGGSDAANNS